MDIEKKEIHIVPPPHVEKAALFALTMLGIFLAILAASELKQYRFIGSGVTASNVISVSGHGEVFAAPDTAEFSITVREMAKDVKTAQHAATQKSNAIIAYLKEAGIEDKDIKTTDYSISPQYEWSQAVCPLNGYCPPGKQVLNGFQVSQTLSVKVKDTAKAGDLLSGVGSRGASEVSGLTFTVADEDALVRQARDKAIAQAKEKANALAQSLGVSMVRIIGFSEEGGARPPVPLYSARAMGAADINTASPQLPTGENKITSDVTITYEIQ